MTITHPLTDQEIFDIAPLGAIIAFSDGTPKPPERFHKKLNAWQSHNGSGRLTRKTKSANPAYRDTFTLHIGNHGSNGTIVVSYNTTFMLGGAKKFAIVETPAVGSVRVLHQWGGEPELLHVASSHVAAEAWLRDHRYSNVILEDVVAISPAGVAA